MKRTRVDEVEAQRALKQRPADELPLFSGEPSSEPAVRQVQVAGHTRTIEGTPAPVVLTKEESIDVEFATFHAAHPNVFGLIIELARAEIASGASRLSVDSLVHEIRKRVKLKINSDFTSRYARLLQEQEPSIGQYVRTRRLISKRGQVAA